MAKSTKAAPAAEKTDPPAEKEPSKKDWKRQLGKIDGVVEGVHDIHQHVVRSSSPSVNSTFGNGWGLPLGYSAFLAGPPKGGKTTLVKDIIGQTHRDYPDGQVIVLAAEMKEYAEMTAQSFRKFGIDPNRYTAYQRNDLGFFDDVVDKIQPMVQDGFPLKLLVIDSANAIVGRRTEDAKSITGYTIGDQAQSLQDAIGWILPFLRRHNVACIWTCHVGVEMDRTEQMRGNSMRAKVAFGFKHRVEYWMFVEKLENKDSKVNMLGQPFEKKDGFVTTSGSKEVVDAGAHKIRVTMKAASFAPVGRVGELTYNYEQGFVAQEEEIFVLAENNKLLTREGNSKYSYGSHRWSGGKPEVLAALKDPKLQSAILLDLQRLDRGLQFNAGELNASFAAGEE